MNTEPCPRAGALQAEIESFKTELMDKDEVFLEMIASLIVAVTLATDEGYPKTAAIFDEVVQRARAFK